MENVDMIEKIASEDPYKNKVHKVLAHSYLLFFILFLVSLFLDFIFPMHRIRMQKNCILLPKTI